MSGKQPDKEPVVLPQKNFDKILVKKPNSVLSVMIALPIDSIDYILKALITPTYSTIVRDAILNGLKTFFLISVQSLLVANYSLRFWNPKSLNKCDCFVVRCRISASSIQIVHRINMVTNDNPKHPLIPVFWQNNV